MGVPEGAAEIERVSPAATVTVCAVSFAVVAAEDTAAVSADPVPFWTTVIVYDLPEPGATLVTAYKLLSVPAAGQMILMSVSVADQQAAPAL